MAFQITPLAGEMKNKQIKWDQNDFKNPMNKKLLQFKKEAEWSITLPQHSSSLQSAVIDPEMLVALNLSS